MFFCNDVNDWSKHDYFFFMLHHALVYLFTVSHLRQLYTLSVFTDMTNIFLCSLNIFTESSLSQRYFCFYCFVVCFRMKISSLLHQSNWGNKGTKEPQFRKLLWNSTSINGLETINLIQRTVSVVHTYQRFLVTHY